MKSLQITSAGVTIINGVVTLTIDLDNKSCKLLTVRVNIEYDNVEITSTNKAFGKQVLQGFWLKRENLQ